MVTLPSASILVHQQPLARLTGYIYCHRAGDPSADPEPQPGESRGRLYTHTHIHTHIYSNTTCTHNTPLQILLQRSYKYSETCAQAPDEHDKWVHSSPLKGFCVEARHMSSLLHTYTMHTHHLLIQLCIVHVWKQRENVESEKWSCGREMEKLVWQSVGGKKKGDPNEMENKRWG